MPILLESPIGPDDHVRGPRDAPVTLLEYGDFECHYCALAFPVVRELTARFGSAMNFVFRHAPQTRQHPNAVLAAEAAEAAGAQGSFWEMHDVLYERRPVLTLEALITEARGLSLDVERFRIDVQERRFRDLVTRIERTGAHTVRGTPTFFLDGVRYEDASDAETLGAAIQIALQAHQ